jgi:hypothetical protein
MVGFPVILGLAAAGIWFSRIIMRRREADVAVTSTRTARNGRSSADIEVGISEATASASSYPLMSREDTAGAMGAATVADTEDRRYPQALPKTF